MENSLLSINNEKNFVYYEISTDSDNVVKDLARLLALGAESEEILDEHGVVVKPATPIVDRCWNVVYPSVDRNLFPDVEDWNHLLPDEYKEVVEHKISKITDSVILKTRTIPKNIKVNNSTAMGVNQDLNKDSIEMYLEIYMPPYLCDSESADPLKQREGYIPEVNDFNGITASLTAGVVTSVINTRIAKNYHHLFMRIFDNLNPEGTGPAENIIDPVTRDVMTWNSRSSSWSKLSWYTDFEEKFLAPLANQPELGMQMGSVRMPVIAGLTSESKIKIWANTNASRVALGVMGSPNVDFSDNRYLIGAAYIGQIDSFDFSVNDTAGNFGLFCTSSDSPAMGKTDIKIRPSVPAVINTSSNVVTAGTGVVGTGTSLPFQSSSLSIFNPGTVYEKDAYEISAIPYDFAKPDGGKEWGSRYVDKSTIKVTCTWNSAPTQMELTDANGNVTVRTIVAPGAAIVPPTSTDIDSHNKRVVKMKLSLEDIIKSFLTNSSDIQAALAAKSVRFKYANYTWNGYTNVISSYSYASLTVNYTFSYYTEYTIQNGGVTRDRFGNAVSTKLDTTYGKNTSNGVTDFAMYATFSKDYFQRHFFMFASTEEYMQKELYGKSVYTGEYFADRIKVVHSSEGPRGILSGMITVDTSSLYPFDELIVNKDFEKYDDKPEELYIYLPVTAQYCPFANSPNGRHGIGILKDIRYPIPVSDDEIVKFAINEVARKYQDLGCVTDDFALLDLSKYGATVTWASTNNNIINVTGILPSVTSVSLSPANATVVKGATKQLTATVVVVGTADQTITWSSSDTDGKVTVDTTGLVTVDAAATAGDYTITATSTFDNTKKATATITV